MLKGLSRYSGRGVFLALACFGLLVAACGGSDSPSGDAGSAEPSASHGDDGIPVVHIPTRWATGNAADLRTLVATNGTVFVGRVTGLKETRLEDPLGGAGPSSDRARVPVSVFEVKVDASLAGGARERSTVLIEQAGGVSLNLDGSHKLFVLGGDEPLAVGERYLFFATTKSNGNLTAPPFGRFTVSGDGTLLPSATWARLGAVQQLAGLRVEEARREIAEAR